MSWARDLTRLEREFCQVLGEVVVFWNHVEQTFRVLLQRATLNSNRPEGRIWSLVAQLSPVQLKDALMAISTDHAPEREVHLRHAAEVFDREREYRNHYVHGPLTFLTTEHTSEALASGVSARGGALRVQQAKVTAAELVEYRDRLGLLQQYLGELLEDSRTLRDGKSLAGLAKPRLATRPVMSKSSWWELHEPES